MTPGQPLGFGPPWLVNGCCRPGLRVDRGIESEELREPSVGERHIPAGGFVAGKKKVIQIDEQVSTVFVPVTIVIPQRRRERNLGQQVLIRLEELRLPLKILVARPDHGQTQVGIAVDIVADRHDEANRAAGLAAALNLPVHLIGHGNTARISVAEIADHEKAEMGRLLGQVRTCPPPRRAPSISTSYG